MDGRSASAQESRCECDGKPMEDVEDVRGRREESILDERPKPNDEHRNGKLSLSGGWSRLSPTQPHVGLLLSVLAVGSVLVWMWKPPSISRSLARGYDENAIKNGLDAELRRKCGVLGQLGHCHCYHSTYPGGSRSFAPPCACRGLSARAQSESQFSREATVRKTERRSSCVLDVHALHW